MLETVAVSAFAFLALAGASHRYRAAAGVVARRETQALRLIAGVLLAVVLVRAGTPLDGERWVRAFGGASIAAAIVVLLLSVRPMMVLSPIRRLLRLAR